MRLGLTQEQTLKLTPQQILLSSLLQLPMQVLETSIQQELESNPVLEIDDEATLAKVTRQKEQEKRSDEDPDYDWEAVFDRYGKNEFIPKSDFDASKEEMDTPLPEESFLTDKMLQQVRTSGLENEDIRIAEEIIWNLDNSGYLQTPLENIAYNLELPVEKVESVLKIVQMMDPVGIAARGLKECLLIQLRANHEEPYVIEILENYFEDFANHRYEVIIREMGLSDDDLRYALQVISQLNPKPGGSESTFSNHYVIPDLIVTEEDGEFIISINDGHIPELRLSRSYEDMIRNRQKLDKATKDYLSKKVESAKWFIQSIHQRRSTMIRVMEAIIRRQEAFFRGEPDALKPMILKDIAEDVSMDISTISRVTNGKYVQCPMGLFELKYFFTEGMKDSDGEDVSTRLIKKTLKEIVDKENKQKPLNDEKLVKELDKAGYKIARRTVAKYREQLNIPIARLRREIL